jgi:hypothetical protein
LVDQLNQLVEGCRFGGQSLLTGGHATGLFDTKPTALGRK